MKLQFDFGPRWGLGLQVAGRHGMCWLNVAGRRREGWFRLLPVLVAVNVLVLVFLCSSLHATFCPAASLGWSVTVAQPDELVLDRGYHAPPEVPAEPALGWIPTEAGPGDTLATIAAMFGLPETTIEEANPGIAPGRPINPPGTPPGEGAIVQVPAWEIRVFRARGGERLTDVAGYYGVRYPAVTLETLVETNALAPDTVLAAGQEVYIPVAGVNPSRGEYVTRGPDGSLVYTARNMIWPAPPPVSRSWGGVANHPAIDLPHPAQYPVRAARAGVIEWAGDPQGLKPEDLAALRALYPQIEPACGYQVIIRHRPDLVTVYGHLLKLERGLAEGDCVQAGQVIGRMGSNGRSTGSHVDFRVCIGDKPVNPLELLVRSGP